MQHMMKVKFGSMCPTCKTTIFSEYRHDFKPCTCNAIFVDGGDDYMRGGGTGISAIRLPNGDVYTLHSEGSTTEEGE